MLDVPHIGEDEDKETGYAGDEKKAPQKETEHKTLPSCN